MPSRISDEDRRRLLAELRALAGAQLQKLWLPSPQVCVLQLRLPGRSLLAVLDARLSMAAIAEARPTSAQSAPRSQATLRNALMPARLAGARLQIFEDRRAATPVLDFETERGARSLIADGALLLADEAGRLLWASSGAQRRPGSILPKARQIDLGVAAPLAGRGALVKEALRAEESAGVAARRKELTGRLQGLVRKLRRTLQAVDEDAARAATADAARVRAELLLPLASKIPRGATQARVPDWSNLDGEGKPAEAIVPLDPALSAAENAARWLRKAKRYQAAAGRIASRRAQVLDEVARAEGLLAQIEAAQDAAQLAAVESEAGAIARPRPLRQAHAPRLPYRKFISAAGAPILVGRSARDNDALTFRIARGNDLWLHVRGMQGSHVVVPGIGDAPDPRLLGDAALLAAHFSSARDADGVEIAWTRCKHVRKPKGAPPGSVIVTQEKTLWLRRDEERVAQLLAAES